MAENTLKTATVLAFERKLDPSDALFYAGNWGDKEHSQLWPAIGLKDKHVRGTISNRRNAKELDPTKIDADIQKPNPQWVDVAALPHNADTLKVSFTLRVLGGTGHPSACNSSGYLQKLLSTVESYTGSQGFGELARRYAYNLANGRFLWRNRVGAEQIEVQVAQLNNGTAIKQWQFDALALSLRHFDADGATQQSLGELAALITDGLSGNRHVLLQITAYVRTGAGQEVFPSQELILDRGRGDKSKTLYHVDHIAAIHSQKLGNAIRTIDSWYPGADELGPIAVEPYGSVTTQGKAYRKPKEKADFYTLLDNWVLKDKVPTLNDQHFVIATLIRGGVFGEAG